jgi:hypothetical protein
MPNRLIFGFEALCSKTPFCYMEIYLYAWGFQDDVSGIINAPCCSIQHVQLVAKYKYLSAKAFAEVSDRCDTDSPCIMHPSCGLPIAIRVCGKEFPPHPIYITWTAVNLKN